MARMTTARTSGGWAAWSASARSSMRWMLSALTGGLSSVIQATWLATSHRTSAFSSSATTKSFSLASTRRDTASGTGPLWVVDCDPAQVKRQRRSPANPPETRGRAAPQSRRTVASESAAKVHDRCVHDGRHEARGILALLLVSGVVIDDDIDGTAELPAYLGQGGGGGASRRL